MQLHKALKKPVLFIGILFLVIATYQYKKSPMFNKDRMNATSCRSALVMLDKRKPATWETHCELNNLFVKINDPLTSIDVDDLRQVKIYHYRELANHLIFIANNTLNESLERTQRVYVTLESSKFRIDAETPGMMLSKFATIRDQKLMIDHLQNSVKIKELLK